MRGFLVARANLDTLLEPWQTGDSFAALTGFSVVGVDLNQRFAPASLSQASAAITGYRQAGAEIATRFAAIGTQLPALGSSLGMPAARNKHVFVGSGCGVAQIIFVLRADGTWTITSFNVLDGLWINSAVAGFGQDYEVIATLISSDPRTDFATDASLYVPISSDRVTTFGVTQVGPGSVAGVGTVSLKVRKIGATDPCRRINHGLFCVRRGDSVAALARK